MQHLLRFAGLLLALTTPSVLPHPAIAESDTNHQLFVSVTVKSGCSLQSGTMAFGEYLSGQPNDLNISGSINFVNCSGYMTLSLDGGTSGNVNARQMSFGEHHISYQLYRNPNRTAVWGEGIDAREVTLLTIQSDRITVYGRIPKLQNVPDGIYTDVVNMTLTF
jgi:spore coat protein U-like protein